MPIEDFFEPVERLRKSFATLIGSREPDRVALIPAASYGIATVAKNLPISAGQEIIVVEDQFPSNYYAWARLCEDAGAKLITVSRPSGTSSWSSRVLEAISPRTAAVAIAQLHWSDGTVFDLEAIRGRTREVDAWLVIDGTQSLGAYPFNVGRIEPDAVVAGGYKWLLGPYGCGYAWYGPRMDHGIPIEENWINRVGSHDFSRLAAYQSEYRPLATRYSVGEHSNFITIPMQQAGLDLLNQWGSEGVQSYTARLWAEITPALNRLGLDVPGQCGHHLKGLKLPKHISRDKLKESLAKRGVTVSYRGELVRVSPNVYNTAGDMERWLDAIRQSGRVTRT